MKPLPLTLILSALGLVACGDCNGASKSEQRAASTPAGSADAGRVVQPAATVKNIAEPELKAFLARWVETQNHGQYEQYAALYASKFYGIKRAGKRERRFDREGWLEDRKRMFQKPITVEVRDVSLRPSTSSAELALMQHFATGNFSDVGPKRLLLVREGNALKIAHEEMLTSRETANQSPTLKVDVDLHSLLIELERGLFIALPEQREPTASGPIRSESEVDADSDLCTTSRTLQERDLDPAPRALKGARFRVATRERGDTGDGCMAEVRGFLLLSRVISHFSQRQEWSDPERAGGALSDPQIDAAAFELGEKMVVAELSGCKAGLYAQRADTPVAAQAEPFEDARLASLARKAFAKQPEVLADQKEWIEGVEGASGKWWDGTLDVKFFRHPVSRQTLASVHARIAEYHCSDIAPRQWLLFELRGNALVPLDAVASDAEVLQVLDVNGDGRLEFLTTGDWFGSSYQLRSPDKNGPSHALTYRYMDCPC